VNPQRGQDHLLATLDGSATVANERFKQVANAAGDCGTCDRWDGWVDFYERILVGGAGHDPCNANSNPTPTITVAGGYTRIQWRCNG
jgi:hypothetical protein